MLISTFAYCYYKNSDIDNIYKPCQISAFDLRPANKKLSSKKKDLVGAFDRKFIILSDNRLRVILISTS